MSDTKKDGKIGTQGTVCPTPKRNISEEPDMIRLKELVGQLSPERRRALNDYLQENDDHEPHTQE